MADRTIMITGGFGALGRALSAAALDQGLRVAAVDISAPPADLDPRVLAIGGADVADPGGAAEAVAKVKARFGRLDALVNVAGGFAWETVADGSPDTWDRLYRMNVSTALNATRAALPLLIASGSGRIVNIGANGALRSAAGMGAYAAAKSGVHRLTESLAEELKDHGVSINAVLPSIIDTAANRADMPDADTARWVAPKDLAAVILFLASEAAGAVTGALTPVVGRM